MAPSFTPDPTHLRHVLLFFYHSFQSATEAHAFLVRMYGENIICYVTIRRRYQRFRNGKFSVEDEERSGRPQEIDLDLLRTVLEADPFQTTRDMALTMGTTHGTVENGLRSLRKKQKL